MPRVQRHQLGDPSCTQGCCPAASTSPSALQTSSASELSSPDAALGDNGGSSSGSAAPPGNLASPTQPASAVALDPALPLVADATDFLLGHRCRRALQQLCGTDDDAALDVLHRAALSARAAALLRLSAGRTGDVLCVVPTQDRAVELVSRLPPSGGERPNNIAFLVAGSAAAAAASASVGSGTLVVDEAAMRVSAFGFLELEGSNGVDLRTLRALCMRAAWLHNDMLSELVSEGSEAPTTEDVCWKRFEGIDFRDRASMLCALRRADARVEGAEELLEFWCWRRRQALLRYLLGNGDAWLVFRREARAMLDAFHPSRNAVSVQAGLRSRTCWECKTQAAVLGHAPMVPTHCGACSVRLGLPLSHTFRCQHCAEEGNVTAFAQQSNLIVHIRTHTGEKPFICRHCAKEGVIRAFAQGAALDVHVRVHTGDKPFTCQHCAKEGKDVAFANNTNLAAHIRTHTGERPFVCQHCAEEGMVSAFLRKHHLTSHIRTHTGDKPYVCEHCADEGKVTAFASSSNLDVHIRTHTGNKPYVCQHCDKDGKLTAFTAKFSLVLHIRTHTGDKPYVCERCAEEGKVKAFSQKSNLAKHMLTHTGEQPFACELCAKEGKHKAFSQKTNLAKHMLTHTGEQPFACELCAAEGKHKAFSQKGNLTRHVSTFH